MLWAPIGVHAQGRPSGAAGPALQVNAAFGTRYRSGNWIPVQVTLTNDGSDFNGTLSIDASNSLFSQGSNSPSTSYRQAVTLPGGSHKQLTMYVPLSSNQQSVIVSLLDNSGRSVVSQSQVLQPLGAGDIFVGLLSDQGNGFGMLNSVVLPNPGGSIVVEPLSASTFPAIPEALKNFNLIILDNFATATLSRGQLSALQSWVSQGGALIAAGGPEGQRTLSALPAGLLPVTLGGSATLPAGTRLLPQDGYTTDVQQRPISFSVQQPVPISTARASSGSETLLASGSIPLLVQAHYGQGSVCYLAFDPALEPLLGWTGEVSLWRSLLLHTTGDQFIVNSAVGQYVRPSPMTESGGLLQTLIPQSVPSPWVLLILLLGYLFFLGPVRFLIVRLTKKRNWSWRIALCCILVFSLLTYGLAVYQKGTETLSSSVSVIQLGRPGAPAHDTTYLGVFVPSQGDFLVQVPRSGLVQLPSNAEFSAPSSNPHTVITLDQNGSNVNLQGVNIWTQYSLVAEQDQQMQGGLTSKLVLQGNVLTGSVTNTLAYGLNDAYVLLGNSVYPVGSIAAGQTLPLRLQVQQSGPGISLADQIASDSNLNPPYDASSNNSFVHNPAQRHAMILATLSGEGSYYSSCSPGCPGFRYAAAVNSVGSGVVVSLNGGPSLGTGESRDPLLLAGAPATLIGWADNASGTAESFTVNGVHPGGIHDTLVQAPLSLDFSGQVSLPPGMISGRLVDARGSNLQAPAPGFYGFSTGSMTFEFSLADLAHLQPGSLKVLVPSDVTQIVRTNSSAPTTKIADSNHLQALLYNWQTHTWDVFNLQQMTFSTSSPGAYIGPGGRVLLKLVNQDASLGTILFDRPLLGLQAGV